MLSQKAEILAHWVDSVKRFSRTIAWFGKTTTGYTHRNPLNRAGRLCDVKYLELSFLNLQIV